MPRRHKPTPHQRYQAPTCGTKKRYPHEAEADKAARTQELLHPELALRSYKCPLCGNWHLTRQAGRQ